MIQVDLAMAYGLGAGLAVANEKRAPDRGFAITLCWFGFLFVPHAMYFIAEHPAWHTMFLADAFDQIPPGVVGAYALLLPTLGAAGFLVTCHLMQRDERRLAWLQVGIGAVATLWILTIGWDGTGWRRFLYAGTAAEFWAGVAVPVTAFFSSPVFYTICWILPAWAVPYLAICRWLRRGAPAWARVDALPPERARA